MEIFKSQISSSVFPLILLAVSLYSSQTSATPSESIKIDDDNWNLILEGEWMVEFYAPWCPACSSLKPIWEDFATWSNDLGIKVGHVDITTSPGLSGRFLINAMPTIFHIREGKFRQYNGPRNKEAFFELIEEIGWESIDPVPWWKSPSSPQMTIISQFYKIAMSLRNVMNMMFEEYGIPNWGAYIALGLIAIVLGLIFGMLLICISDCIYRRKILQLNKDSDDEDNEGSEDEDSEDENGEKNEENEEKSEEKSSTSPKPAAVRRKRRD